MYLTEGIVDVEAREYPMVGNFPTRSRMQKRLAKVGYTEVEATDSEGAWLMQGERARGHEFRYSTMDAMSGTMCPAYKSPAEGYRVRSVLASYIHLHFLSCPAFAGRFVDLCARRKAAALLEAN